MSGEEVMSNPTTVIIADNAFTNRVDLNGISIPGSVKVIGENAFNNCLNLEMID